MRLLIFSALLLLSALGVDTDGTAAAAKEKSGGKNKRADETWSCPFGVQCNDEARRGKGAGHYTGVEMRKAPAASLEAITGVIEDPGAAAQPVSPPAIRRRPTVCPNPAQANPFASRATTSCTPSSPASAAARPRASGKRVTARSRTRTRRMRQHKRCVAIRPCLLSPLAPLPLLLLALLLLLLALLLLLLCTFLTIAHFTASSDHRPFHCLL